MNPETPEPGFRTSSNAPIKVSPATRELVRYGAVVFALTQGEFVERAVADYVQRHAEEMERRVSEVQARARDISSGGRR